MREVLPTNFKPTHYELEITPNFNDFTFLGKVKVNCQVNEPSDTIQLNANELEIISVNVNGLKGSHSLNEEVLTLKFDSKLEEPFVLDIDFKGCLNDKMAGFYRSEYESNGVKK